MNNNFPDTGKWGMIVSRSIDPRVMRVFPEQMILDMRANGIEWPADRIVWFGEPNVPWDDSFGIVAIYLDHPNFATYLRNDPEFKMFYPKVMRCVQCDNLLVPGNNYCHVTTDHEHEGVWSDD